VQEAEGGGCWKRAFEIVDIAHFRYLPFPVNASTLCRFFHSFSRLLYHDWVQGRADEQGCHLVPQLSEWTGGLHEHSRAARHALDAAAGYACRRSERLRILYDYVNFISVCAYTSQLLNALYIYHIAPLLGLLHLSWSSIICYRVVWTYKA
jgi:hypothetical protein